MKYTKFFTLFAAFLLAKTGNAEAITLKDALEKAYKSAEKEALPLKFLR